MIELAHCLLRKLIKFRLIVVNVCLFLACSLTILQLAIEPEHHAEGNVPRPSAIQWIGQYERDQACQFPLLDPFDPSILPYVHHPYPLFCQRVQPELTYMNNNWLMMDLALTKRHQFRKVYYRNIDRKNETHIKYGNWTKWNITMSPRLYLLQSVEVVGLYQFDPRDKKSAPKRYRNLHASIHLDNGTINKKLERLLSPSSDSDQMPNVLIFGIDSLSRSNFIRNLPKTFRVLNESMKSIVFRGYTKIDDNTFPNILAILTGHKVTIHGSELNGHFQRDFVDHYPFIWKNFSANGYVTGLAEEQPGVLSYKAKGFQSSPVDWYLRPFGIALGNSPLRKYSSPYCVGNRAESRIILDAIDRFITAHHQNGIPHFLFSFLWKLSHDKTYDVEMIDGIIADFFDRLFRGGYFNNTIIFVMSDHGNRFDTIRRTLIGRYEERMPYLSLYLPPWFRDKYPSAVENLNKNVWRLTCQYDVYETLIDIANGRYGDDQRARLKNRGYSLFSQVPKSRTCQQANISAHYCVCQKEENLDLHQSPIPKLAAEYAVKEINRNLLASNKEARNLCGKLKLSQVVAAQKYKATDNVRYAIRWHYNKLLSERNVTWIVSHVRVTFITAPNRGIYEALIQYYEIPEGPLRVDGALDKATMVDVSRVNPYGNEGDCVSNIDRNLEKFCYCRTKWFQ